MDRIFLTFILTLFISFEAEAKFRPLARYFKLVPEAQAHTSIGQAHETELNKDSIKVFVWNIKKAQLSNWKNEFTTYGKDQDVFLIQEAYGTELFTSTLDSFEGYRWEMGASFLYRLYNDRPTGNMIGANVEPSDVLVKHSVDLEPVVYTPKATTFAKYPLTGSDKELLVISVHAINITTLGTFKRHMAQAEEEIKKHDGPVLWAGDFNTRTKARTQHLMKLINTLGFRPVEFKNGHRRMKFKFTPYYLDHSFVRGLNVKAAEVYGDSYGSDHKPMALEVSLAQ